MRGVAHRSRFVNLCERAENRAACEPCASECQIIQADKLIFDKLFHKRYLLNPFNNQTSLSFVIMEGQTAIINNLRFVESRTKLRIAQNGYKAPCEKLVAAANEFGLVIVASHDDSSVKAIPLNTLLDVDQSKSSIIDFNQFSFSIQLNFKPTILTVSRSTLLVLGTSQSNCPALEAYDLEVNRSLGSKHIEGLGYNTEIIDYAWHPNYREIVALCTNQGHLLVIAISKQNGVSLVYNNQQYKALTCCWSPKGKNLAIGTFEGNVLRLEPVIANSSFTFKEVASPINFSPRTTITPDHQVVRLRWINRTFLMCVHARPVGELDTTYSIITAKAGKPYVFWKNLYFESRNQQNYKVYLANLSNYVVCTSSSTGEAAVIGIESDKEASDLGEWKSIIIDEEGARIELPLDSNNVETHSVGVTTAISHGKLVLIFLTNDGVLCPYTVLYSGSNLKLPDPQPEMKLPDLQSTMILPDLQPTMKLPDLQSIMKLPDLQQTMLKLPDLQASMRLPDPQPTMKLTDPRLTMKLPDPQPTMRLPETEPKMQLIDPQPDMKLLVNLIEEIKRGIQDNSTFMASLREINLLREQFVEIEDFHKLHKEALDAMKEDINSLDLTMLEILYLIEYIKSRSGKKAPRRVDPNTSATVENIKKQSKIIATKLEELNSNVEVSWENFVRSRGTMANRKLNSLEIIYKTLATNQKIINLLKRKVPQISSSPEQKPESVSLNIKELNPARIRYFREFLSSRTVVPVRRPIRSE